MLLPRTVLCATDLSETGDAAVPIAHDLVADGGTVHLLHVIELTAVTDAAGATHRAEVERRLADLLPPSSRARGVRTQVHVRRDADAATVIAREADRLRVDALVLGTHGRGLLGKALLGSVASAVLRRTRIPVVLVRPSAAVKSDAAAPRPSP